MCLLDVAVGSLAGCITFGLRRSGACCHRVGGCCPRTGGSCMPRFLESVQVSRTTLIAFSLHPPFLPAERFHNVLDLLILRPWDVCGCWKLWVASTKNCSSFHHLLQEILTTLIFCSHPLWHPAAFCALHILSVDLLELGNIVLLHLLLLPIDI